MKPVTLKRLFSWYGPYFGAGIKVEQLDEDWRYCKVSMKLCWYNKNAVGVHFGGSLYSMIDPHYMLLLTKLLGAEYTVWDKAASINFIRPGKGYVWAEFRVTDDMLADVYKYTQHGKSYCPTYSVAIKDNAGNAICSAQKTLYIKKQPQTSMRI